jgi:uncharacterized protein
MTRVVSNASPLVSLARIVKVDLLRQLLQTLVIPEAVWREVVTDGVGQPGADEVASADWITTVAVTNTDLVTALRQELDAGEAEAIALTLELEADVLLMDERLGRETARHLGLRYIGLIGALIEARNRGIIASVKPVLDALRDQASFHISEALYARILADEQVATAPGT